MLCLSTVLASLHAALAAAQSINATLMVFTAGLLPSQALEHSGDQAGAGTSLRSVQDPITTSVGGALPGWPRTPFYAPRRPPRQSSSTASPIALLRS